MADMFWNAFLQWKPAGYLGSDDVSTYYNNDGKEEEEEEEENANLQERDNFSAVVGNASVERLLPVMVVFGNVSLL